MFNRGLKGQRESQGNTFMWQADNKNLCIRVINHQNAQYLSSAKTTGHKLQQKFGKNRNMHDVKQDNK